MRLCQYFRFGLAEVFAVWSALSSQRPHIINKSWFTRSVFLAVTLGGLYTGFQLHMYCTNSIHDFFWPVAMCAACDETYSAFNISERKP